MATIVLVVGNAALLDSNDTAIRDRLVALGHTVTIKSDDDAELAESQYDAVVIAASITPGTIAAKYASSTKGVLVGEWRIWDDTDWNLSGSRRTRGGSGVTIIDTAHPLAAGYSGTVQVYASGTLKGTANDDVAALPASAQRVATADTFPTETVIFAYAAGATNSIGGTIAGIRVCSGLLDTWSTDADYIALFDADITYILPSGAEEHSGGSGATLNASAAGSGKPGFKNGSATDVNATASAGAGTPNFKNGTEATVNAVSTGSGKPGFKDGSEATVAVAGVGAGSPAVSSGAATDVNIAATGSGSPSTSGGSPTDITAGATGSGTPAFENGSEATVNVVSTGGGTTAEGGAGGSDAIVGISGTGAGIVALSNGSEATVTAGAVGSGSPSFSDGAEATVVATGTGAGSLTTSGGSAVDVAVAGAGSGAPGFEGGAATSMNVGVSAAEGIANVSNGSAAVMRALATGAGTPALRNGSSALVQIVVTGAGAIETAHQIFGAFNLMLVKRSIRNLCPPFHYWTLAPGSGVAEVDVFGVLHIANGGQAYVYVHIDEAERWTVSKETKPFGLATQYDPDSPGRHSGFSYFGADKTTAVANSAGWTSNGDASPLDEGVWSPRGAFTTALGLAGDGFWYWYGGPGVVWIKWSLVSATVWSSAEQYIRRPMIIAGPPQDYEPFEPYEATDELLQGSGDVTDVNLDKFAVSGISSNKLRTLVGPSKTTVTGVGSNKTKVLVD